MALVTETTKQVLDRILSIEIVRVTERAAVSAARLRGRGNEKEADQAAVDAIFIAPPGQIRLASRFGY